jgi:O-antigen ligase
MVKPSIHSSKKKPARREGFDRYFLPLYSGFIFLILPFFIVTNAIDYSLMPRFMVLSLFITGLIVLMMVRGSMKIPMQMFHFAIVPMMVLYLLVIIISVFFAYNKLESIFDATKWLMFIVVLMVGVVIFVNDPRWAGFQARLAVISGIIASLIGLVQYYRFVILAPKPFLPDGRSVVYLVEGVMSHKNLFSLSILMMMPWVGYAIYVFRGKWRLTALVSMLLMIIMVVLLLTRAVWLGMIISLPVILMLFLHYFRQSINKLLFRSGVIALAIGMIGFMGFIYISQVTRINNSFADKLMSIVRVSTWKTEHRLKTWQITVEMIGDHPVSGVGAGNWQIEAPRYYAGKFTGDQELNWIRPHNDYLWVWSEKGLIGFLLYLGFFGITIFYLLRTVKAASLNSKVLSLFLLWGLLGYMTASFFDFPYERPFHMTMLAVIMTSALVLRMQQNPDWKETPQKKPVIMLLLALGSVLASVYGASAYHQETNVKQCLTDASSGNWSQLYKHSLEAQSVFKNLDNWANPIYSYTGKALEESGEFVAALEAYKEAYRANPTKIKVITNLARCYEKAKLYKEGISMLDSALKILPRDKKLLMQKSDIYYAAGEYRLALKNYGLIADFRKDTLIMQNMRYLRYLKNKVKVASPDVRK